MIKNIFANLVGRIWSLLSGFLFIPLYINILGFEKYSIISFTMVVAGIMTVMDAGLSAALSREFAKLNTNNNHKIKVLKTLESLYLLIALLCITLIFLLSNSISTQVQQSTLNQGEMTYILRILSIEIVLQMLFRFYSGGLLGLDQQVRANVIQVFWGIFRNALVLIVIVYFPLLEYFFLWQLLSTLIFTIIVRVNVTYRLADSPFFLYKPLIDRSIIRGVGPFAVGMFFIAVVAAVNTQLDKLMISRYLDLEILGYYNLAITISTVIIVIINPLSIAVLPRFTGLHSLKDTKQFNELFNVANTFAATLVIIFVTHLIFFGKELLWIWTGDMDLAIKSSIYVPFSSVAFGMMALTIIPYNVAIASGYTKLNNRLGLLSIIISIPGFWFSTIHFGSIGTVIVFAFVQTLISIIYIYKISIKFLDHGTIRWSRVYLIPICISFVMLSVIGRVLGMAEFSRLFVFGVIVCSGIISFLACAFILFKSTILLEVKNVFYNE